MKRLCALLCLLLALCACTASTPQEPAPQFQLYFISAGDYGPAITPQPYTGDLPPSPQALIHALLAGPEDDDLISPFPGGLTLRGCKPEDGCLQINFSEHYGGLADISLTLADYCLVLTLCQLESVQSVEILVAGSPIPHRSHQILIPQEALLALEGSTPSS